MLTAGQKHNYFTVIEHCLAELTERQVDSPLAQSAGQERGGRKVVNKFLKEEMLSFAVIYAVAYRRCLGLTHFSKKRVPRLRRRPRLFCHSPAAPERHQPPGNGPLP